MLLHFASFCLILKGAWYPREHQERQYMGAGGTFIGPYAMGFFAGFTIESDDVTIDLNGHEIGMSTAFHLQQRWFAVIEIGSKAFISGQGPGNFGPYMVYANNVVIKNGIIGRYCSDCKIRFLSSKVFLFRTFSDFM